MRTMASASRGGQMLRIKMGYRFDELAGAGYQLVKKNGGFVGRAFRQDRKSAPSSGVSTPEGLPVNLLARLDVCHVNCFRRVVVSAGDLDLLFGKRRRLFLIV